MSAASYTAEPEYRALLDGVRASPADETARRVLADWVQDHGDEAEAEAIRAHVSEVVDLVPALVRAMGGLVGSCTALLRAYAAVLPAGADGIVETIVRGLAGIMSAMEPPASEVTQG